jgi:hypothetical protein
MLHRCNASVVPIKEQQIPIYVMRGMFLDTRTGNGVGFKTTGFFNTGSRSARQCACGFFYRGLAVKAPPKSLAPARQNVFQHRNDIGMRVFFRSFCAIK